MNVYIKWLRPSTKFAHTQAGVSWMLMSHQECGHVCSADLLAAPTGSPRFGWPLMLRGLLMNHIVRLFAEFGASSWERACQGPCSITVMGWCLQELRSQVGSRSCGGWRQPCVLVAALPPCCTVVAICVGQCSFCRWRWHPMTFSWTCANLPAVL